MIPSDRPLSFVEDAAFAIGQGIPVTGVTSSEILAFARRIISEAIDEPPENEERESAGWDAHNRRKLDSAGQVISTIASSIASEASLRADLEVLACLAFALDGNVTAALLRARLAIELLQVNRLELAVVALGCPAAAIDCVAKLQSPEAVRLAQESHAVAAGFDTAPERVASAAAAYYWSQPSSSLGYLLSLALRAHERAREQRFDKVLKQVGFSDWQATGRNLARSGRAFALPSQVTALSAPGIFGRRGAFLVTLPTGSGKTMVGLLTAAASAANPSDVCVYIAPYHAIRRQATRAAQDVFGHRFEVGARVPKSVSDRPAIVIATPESFDRQLRSDPTILERVVAIVCDEAHTLGRDSRGLLTESLLSRFRVGRPVAMHPKMVLLSAVLDDSSGVDEWLTSADAGGIVESRWRPSAKRIAVWEPDGKLSWVRTVLTANDQRNLRTTVHTRIDPPFVDLGRGNPFAIDGPRWRKADANAALLATALFDRNPSPTLLVVGTKSRTRQLARAVAARLPDPDGVMARRDALSRHISAEYPLFSDLAALVRKGVAYHNASMPLHLRGLIESACEEMAFNFVCATTTLAEGADLPFGRCIVADWTFPVSHDRFQASLLRNIAGRCGRPSSHVAGETIIVEHIPPVAHASRKERRRELEAMLLEEVTVTSGFDSVLNGNRKSLDQLLSQAMATVSEHPGLDEPHRELLFDIVSARLAGEAVSAAVLRRVEDMLLGGEQPMATRNSPVTLSPLGQAVLHCSVFPSTALMLSKWVANDKGGADEVRLCTELLLACADAPELSESSAARVLRGKTVGNLPVRTSSLSDFLRLWLDGMAAPDIFGVLVSQDSRFQDDGLAECEEWIRGQRVEVSEIWRVRFEKFIDFARITACDFLPRALVSAKTMAEATVGLVEWTAKFDELALKLRRRAAELTELEE